MLCAQSKSCSIALQLTVHVRTIPKFKGTQHVLMSEQTVYSFRNHFPFISTYEQFAGVCKSITYNFINLENFPIIARAKDGE